MPNPTVAPAPPAGKVWAFAWGDEFDDTAGNSGPSNGLDRTKWNIGYLVAPTASPSALGVQNVTTPPVGGSETEYYGPAGVTLPGDGMCHLKMMAPVDTPTHGIAHSEAGMIQTANLALINPLAITSGVPSVRANLTGAQVWEAQIRFSGPSAGADWQVVWTTNGGNCNSTAGWSVTGWQQESDWWEQNGGTSAGSSYNGHYHGGTLGDRNLTTVPGSLAGTDFSAAFHTFTMWTDGTNINFYVDGTLASTAPCVNSNGHNVWAQPHYLMFAFQARSNEVNPRPDMQIQYVRAYTLQNATAVPDAPTILASDAGDLNAGLIWSTPPQTPITEWTVELSSTQGIRDVIVPGADQGATITGLTNGVTYTAKVKAKNASGYGPFSAPVTLTPAAPPPTGTTIGDSLGGALGTVSVWGTTIQTQFLTKHVVTDRVWTWPRFDYYPQNAISKGWHPGAAVSNTYWSDLDAFYDRAHAAGVRKFLTIVNTRNPGFGSYRDDGDFVSSAGAATVQAFGHDLAQHLAARYPDSALAYECGNEVPLMQDGAGIPSCPDKYMTMYASMHAGLVAGDGNCEVGPGSTLHAVTALAGRPGANFYGQPQAGGSRMASQTDWTINICNPAIVGANTLQAVGCHFYVIHPYCLERGPNGVFGTPAGQFGPDIVINGLREVPYIAFTLAAVGLSVPLWGTEFGFPTAASWKSGMFSSTGTVLFPHQGTPTADLKNWNRPPLYIATSPTSTQPGTSAAWSVYTPGSYDAGEAANAIATENEAGQHWYNSARQWMGLDVTVDGQGIGQFTGVLFAFEPLDEPTSAGFRYGLQYAAVTDKGAPATAGPYQRLLGLASLPDTRNADSAPDVPIGVTAVAADRQAVVAWIAGVSDGGQPITSYRVTVHASDPVDPANGRTFTTPALSVTATGLTDGITYTFTVAAQNSVGYSAESAPSNAVTPVSLGVPGAPRNVVATAGNRYATVRWTAPASSGGSPVDRYRVTCSTGAVKNVTGFVSVTFDGLTNGVSVTFTVQAHNVSGFGAASPPSNAVVPKDDGGGGNPPPPPPTVRLSTWSPQASDLLDGTTVGVRADRFSFELLSGPYAHWTAEPLTVSAAQPVTVSYDGSRSASFRTCSNVEIPYGTLDALTARLRVSVVIQSGDVFPVGVFRLGQQNRLPRTSGTVSQPSLFDDGWLLDQPTDHTFSLVTGRSVVGFVGTVLAELGIAAEDVLFLAPDVVAGAPSTWKAGTSRYQILKDCGLLLACYQPFFNNAGLLTFKPIAGPDPAADHRYGFGNRIVDGSIVETDDSYQAPNRYVVVGTGPKGEIVGVYDVPAGAPQSFANRGIRVARTVNAASVASVVQANAAARAAFLTDRASQTYLKVGFSATLDPRHDLFDVIAYDGVPYLETGWQISCQSGAPMTHSATKLWTE